MNGESSPPPLPPGPPSKPEKEAVALSFFLAMIMAGVGLFLFAVIFCFPALVPIGKGTPIPLIVATILAFVSVFFRGFRGVFFGFFISLGLSLFLLVAICFGIISGVSMK